MADASVRGAQELEALGQRLKRAGGKELRRELLRGVRNSNKGTIARIRDSARNELPHEGGLADLVAGSRFSTRTRLSGTRVGVTIEGSNRSIRALRQLNAGRLRHPVFGNRKVWAQQQVAAGWFDRPVTEDLPEIRSAIQRVMKDVARRIEKG